MNLLSPEIFGLVTISMSIFFLTQGFLNLGFDSAIIQDNMDNNTTKIYSAWTLEIIKGLFLSSSLFFMSDFISIFLENDSLSFLLKLTSLIFIIDSLKNIKIILLKKEMKFKKIFFLEFLPYFFSTVLTILVALKIKEAWVVIAGIILNKILYVIMSYIITDYKFKLDFNLNIFKDLFDFGKWIFASSILTIFRVQGINLFLGKFIGIDTLGVYGRSSVFSEELFNQLNNLYWKFNFPYLSSHNTNQNNFFNAFYNSFKFIFFFALLFLLSITIISKSFMNNFFDPTIWKNLDLYINLLSIYSFLVIIQSPLGIMYQAIGSPKYGTRINLLSTLLIIISIYPSYYYFEIFGVLFSLIFSSAISFLYNYYISKKIFKIDFYKIFNSIKNILARAISLYVLFFVFNIYFEIFYINLFYPITLIFIEYKIYFKKYD